MRENVKRRPVKNVTRWSFYSNQINQPKLFTFNLSYLSCEFSLYNESYLLLICPVNCFHLSTAFWTCTMSHGLFEIWLLLGQQKYTKWSKWGRMPRYVFKKRVVPAVLQKASLNFPDKTLEITMVGFVWNQTTLIKKLHRGWTFQNRCSGVHLRRLTYQRQI